MIVNLETNFQDQAVRDELAINLLSKIAGRKVPFEELEALRDFLEILKQKHVHTDIEDMVVFKLLEIYSDLPPKESGLERFSKMPASFQQTITAYIHHSRGVRDINFHFPGCECGKHQKRKEKMKGRSSKGSLQA